MNKKLISLSFLMSFFSTYSHSAQIEEKIGNWRYLSIEKKMDDTMRYLAVADGDEGSIVFKCDSVGPNSVYVGFYSKKYLGRGRDSMRKLTYRIDKGPQIQDQWTYDKSSAHLFDNEMAYALAKSLDGARRIVINALTYDFESVEAEIQLFGSDTAIKRILKDCKN